MWYLDLRWSCFSLFNLEDLLNWGNGGLNFNFLQIEHAWLWMNFEFILKKRSVISWRISRKWIAGNLLSSPLRALGLLLADSAPTVGRGKTFWHVDRVFSLHNSETKSKKIDPKVGNEPSRQGLQTGRLTKIGVVLQKLDSWIKNRDLGPKKKRSLHDANHVLATTGLSCAKKKVGVFWGINRLWAKKRLLDQT